MEGERTPSESMKQLNYESVPLFFNEILHQNSNHMCIDCGSVDCEWASLGFGTFICLKCAGNHRSMGTHITLVRSITLDGWTDEQLRILKKAGNMAFQEYVSSLNVGDNVNHPTEKYNIPEVLYYTEILAAKLAHREPTPYKLENWVCLTPKAKAAVNSGIVLKNHPTWIPDSNAKCCMLCFKEFTVIARRHHCRRCGRLTCHHCAPKNNSRPILEWGLKDPVRHCKECYKSPALTWRDD